MIGFNGGLIGGFRDTTTWTASVPGVWTANEQVVAQRRGTWARLADPFFSSVSLLLPGDGANGSTSIIDRSPSPKTITVVGNAQIGTAQSKFGGSSIAFDGNGDYLNTGANASPDASSSFTVEAWVYPNAFDSDRVLYDCRSPGSALGSGWALFVNPSARLQVFGNTGILYAQSSSGLFLGSSSNFQHVAIVCSAGTWTYYIQGQNAGSFSAAPSAPQNTRIGAREDGLAGFNGFIDDLRITKGVARYTTNFTPPTAPHPLF